MRGMRCRGGVGLGWEGGKLHQGASWGVGLGQEGGKLCGECVTGGRTEVGGWEIIGVHCRK